MASTRSIEILCWALAACVLVWSRAVHSHPWPVMSVLGVFAAAIVVFRTRGCLPRHPVLKLQIEAASMVVFITTVLWFTGRNSSPALNLYLLPLILSALTLGRWATVTQVAVVAACHLALAAATPGVEVMSLTYASQAVGQLAPFLLVAYLTTTLSADFTEAREHIENLAQTDSLTGLFNQRMFDEVWQREHALAERGSGVYSLLMIDLDRLKELNDQFGQEGGNAAIELVGRCLQRSIRGTDSAARFGGDEFAMLLPGASAEVAEAVVKRIRHNVYKTTLDLGSQSVRCSVGIGIASFPKDGRDRRELLAIAERKLDRDKELRRMHGGAVGA